MPPNRLISEAIARAISVGAAIFLNKYFLAVSLYFRYWVTAVRIPRIIAIKISILLYAKEASSPTVNFVPLNPLITGREVEIITNNADKNNTRDPINIQNSLDQVFSSLTRCGIFLSLPIKSIPAGNRKTKMNVRSWKFIPESTNACTEVSPSTPLRVRKVEYRIKIKLSIKNKKVARKE